MTAALINSIPEPWRGMITHLQSVLGQERKIADELLAAYKTRIAKLEAQLADNSTADSDALTAAWIDGARSSAALVGAAYEAAAASARSRHEVWASKGVECLVDDDVSACSDIAAAIEDLCPADATAALQAERDKAWGMAIEAAKAVRVNASVGMAPILRDRIDALHTPASRAAVKGGE